MANMKEKTPMCLINELAKYNKISHEYKLIDETGPAHAKVFKITLELGPEERYTATGLSIKKAQHSAAAIALEQTKFNKPAARSRLNQRTNSRIYHPAGGQMPTSELSAIAARRNEDVNYSVLQPPRPPYIPNFDFRGMYTQRYHYPKFPYTYYVSLRVGNRDFVGEGRTAQMAKHNAAAKAVKVLKDDPSTPPAPTPPLPAQPPNSADVGASGDGNHPTAVRSTPPSTAQTSRSVVQLGDEYESSDRNPVSLIYEVAFKRQMRLDFQVVSESGQAHNRVYVTRCTLGDISFEGDGHSKKLSKRRAAAKTLDHVNKTFPELPERPQIDRQQRQQNYYQQMQMREMNGEGGGHMGMGGYRPPGMGMGGYQGGMMRGGRRPFYPKKKKPSNLNTENKEDPDYGEQINPISRLIHIQQAKKLPDPVYSVVAERGAPRVREFVMQVVVNGQSAQGAGPNKKTAKRLAAEEMLKVMGYSQSQPVPGKPTLKQQDSTGSSGSDGGTPGDKSRKVTFSEQDNSAPTAPEHHSRNVGGGGASRGVQPPGVLYLDRKMANGGAGSQPQQQQINMANIYGVPQSHEGSSPQPSPDLSAPLPQSYQQLPQQPSALVVFAKVVAREMFERGYSPTALSKLEATRKAAGLSSQPHMQPQVFSRAEQRLSWLAEIIGGNMTFTDFPKGNKNEYLSLVSFIMPGLLTPQVHHGSGPTLEASHDQACMSLLSALANFTGHEPQSQQMNGAGAAGGGASGDGGAAHVKPYPGSNMYGGLDLGHGR